MVPCSVLSVLDFRNLQLLLILGSLVSSSELLLLGRVDLPQLDRFVISC
jgi:hypothetical protein